MHDIDGQITKKAGGGSRFFGVVSPENGGRKFNRLYVRGGEKMENFEFSTYPKAEKSSIMAHFFTFSTEFSTKRAVLPLFTKSNHPFSRRNKTPCSDPY